MCTSIALKTPAFFFGRNLDLEYAFGQQPVVAPRAFAFPVRRAGELRSRYAMVGMATVRGGYPLFAEAANERGLCMAGLNFPGNACYSPEEAPGKQSITPFELIPWLLGQCATAQEARALLEKTNVIAIPFDDRTPLAPLHWHIADKEESLVLEVMRDGMHLYENPVHVMTNNPPFDFHLTNLRQYMNVTRGYAVNRFSDTLPLTPFGNGLGGIGLPGDLSPASRFARAAFMLHNTMCGPDEESGVSHFFHLLDSVAMPSGSVITAEGLPELTDYACCYSAETQTYYYKTYRNNRITAIRLTQAVINGPGLTCYPLRDRQDIRYENGEA